MRSALATANPALAEKIPARVQGALASLGQGQVEHMVVRLWDVSRRSQWLAGTLGLGGGFLVLCGVLLVANPRQAMARLGLDLLVAGVMLYLLGPAGRGLVSSLPPDPLVKGAAAGLWDAYTPTLRTWAFVLGAIGLVFQAASHTLLERFDIQVAAKTGPDLARGPARRPARAVSPGRPPAGSGCFGCSAARGRCLVPGGPGLGARGLRRAAADVRARFGRPSRRRGRGFDGNGTTGRVPGGGRGGPGLRAHGRYRLDRPAAPGPPLVRLRCLQRSTGALRPPPGRGRLSRHAQLDVLRRHFGLDVPPAGARHPGAAGGRDPGLPLRRALRAYRWKGG